MKRIALIAVAFCLASHANAAQETVEPEVIKLDYSDLPAFIDRLLVKRQFATVLEIATQLLRTSPQDSQYLFYAGFASFNLGKYDDAVKYYRAILQNEPDALRVRLELARSLFHKKEYLAAKHHFQLALGNDDMNEKVEKNIRNFISQIHRRRNWSLWFGGGFVYDSNVNNGTSLSSINIAGIDFKLDESSRASSGVGFNYYANGHYNIELNDDIFWKTDFNINRDDYTGSKYDQTYLNLRTGPLFVTTNSKIWPFYTTVYRDYGNTKFSTEQGVGLEFNTMYDRFLPYLQAQNRRISYDDDFSPQTRNGEIWEWSLGSSYILDAKSSINLGLTLSNEDTRQKTLGSTSEGFRVGYYRDWEHGITTDISVRYSIRKYNGIQPTFNKQRVDQYISTDIGLLKRDWQIYGIAPMLVF